MGYTKQLYSQNGGLMLNNIVCVGVCIWLTEINKPFSYFSFKTIVRECVFFFRCCTRRIIYYLHTSLQFNEFRVLVSCAILFNLLLSRHIYIHTFIYKIYGKRVPNSFFYCYLVLIHFWLYFFHIWCYSFLAQFFGSSLLVCAPFMVSLTLFLSLVSH